MTTKSIGTVAGSTRLPAIEASTIFRDYECEALYPPDALLKDAYRCHTEPPALDLAGENIIQERKVKVFSPSIGNGLRSARSMLLRGVIQQTS